jgi:hypothetical protein
LTSFLKEFVDNNFGKASLRRTVIESSYVERMFGVPPALSAMDQPSILVPDRGLKYCLSYCKFHCCNTLTCECRYIHAMLLGQEVNLVLFDILVYSIVDLWFSSTATSILITYLVDSAVVWIRATLGKVSVLYIRCVCIGCVLMSPGRRWWRRRLW